MGWRRIQKLISQIQRHIYIYIWKRELREASNTSWMSSGLLNRAAPIPPWIEKALGQPMLISTAATSLHLRKWWNNNNSYYFKIRTKRYELFGGEYDSKTYTISAALRALTASEVPIWKTTLSLSSSHVLKTTFSVPFSTNSVVPEATAEGQ